MWPDGVDATTVGFAFPGIDHKDFVDESVAVPVVVGKVHLRIGSHTHLRHHLLGTQVIAIAVIFAVVFITMFQSIGAYHVEDHVEQAAALIAEIVSDAAYEFPFVVAYGVEDVIVFLPIVGRLAELRQDDQSVLCADERVAVFGRSPAQQACPGVYLSCGFSAPASYAPSLCRGREGHGEKHQQNGI